LEPAEEDGEFFAETGGFLVESAVNFIMVTAAAFLEPTEEDGLLHRIIGFLGSKCRQCSLVHRNGSFLGTTRREWRLLSRCVATSA
jgi:hypothetical protein